MMEEVETPVPYNFQLFVYSPNRKVIGFHFVFDPSAMYTIGVFESITHNFARRGIPIIHFAVSFTLKGPSYGVVFVDLSESEDVNVDEMHLELRRYPYILDVKLLKPLFEGFVFDSHFFPLKVGDERGVIFLKRGYRGLIKKAREQLGPTYELTLYLEGYNLSIEAFKEYVKMTGEDHERIIKLGEALFQHLGYGRITLENLSMEEGEATIKIQDCFECELFKGSKKPESHLIRGMLAGWLTQLFNRGVKVTETKCIAKGDPHCQFEVKAT